jgi:hypothetical protein
MPRLQTCKIQTPSGVTILHLSSLSYLKLAVDGIAQNRLYHFVKNLPHPPLIAGDLHEKWSPGVNITTKCCIVPTIILLGVNGALLRSFKNMTKLTLLKALRNSPLPIRIHHRHAHPPSNNISMHHHKCTQKGTL